MFTTSEYTVRFYVGAVRRRWVWVVLVAVVVTLFGASPTLQEDPVYESTVSLRLHSGGTADASDGRETTLVSQPVDAEVLELLTEVEVIRSRTLRDQVTEELGDDAAPFETAEVSLRGLSSVIAIRVTASTPEAATATADAYARVYLRQRLQAVVAPLREQIEALRTERERLADELAVVETALADPMTEPFRLDTLRLELSALEAESRSLGLRIDELDSEADRRDRQTTVVSEASSPGGPIPRDRARSLATWAVVGLAAGLVGAIAIEVLRDRVTSDEDLADLDQRNSVIGGDAGPGALLAGLRIRGHGDGGDAMAVVDTDDGGSGRDAVEELAVGAAAGGTHVVVFDAAGDDELERRLSASAGTGEGDVEYRRFSHRRGTVLDGGALTASLDEAATTGALALVHCPPTTAGADWLSCAHAAGGALVAVRLGRARRQRVAAALRTLDGADVRVIGLAAVAERSLSSPTTRRGSTARRR